MNKSPIILTLMVSLIVSVGCAKSDWIQSTLVTVDVTGRWRADWRPRAYPSAGGVKDNGNHAPDWRQ
jgi:hypothetical protein